MLRATEINRLFKVCQRDPILGSRDAAIVAVLVYAGLRRSELVSLNIVDYGRRSGQLIVREGKDQRELFLPALARDYLRQWLQHRGSAPGVIFCQLAKHVDCL